MVQNRRSDSFRLFDFSDYLLGEDFSNGAHIQIGGARSKMLSRNEWILKQVTGRSVLHLGAADHLPLIRKKMEEGNYLHTQLAARANKVVGLDIDRTALNEMRLLGIENLHHVDDFPKSSEFDVLLATDVIEHVMDVGLFLRSLHEFNCEEIILTTPNAFRLSNRARFRAEVINTDHKYWFSPYTLAKVVTESGFQIKHLTFTGTVSWKRPLSWLLNYNFPLVREGLAVVLKSFK